MFPRILNQNSPYFSLENSKFNIDVSKESTARACMYRLLRDTPNVFTIETSYFGFRDKSQQNAFVQFNPNHLTNYGTNILDSIYHYHHFLLFFAHRLGTEPRAYRPAVSHHLNLPALLPDLSPPNDITAAFYLKVIAEFEEELSHKITH